MLLQACECALTCFNFTWQNFYTFSSVPHFHIWPLLFWTGNKCTEGWPFPAHAQRASWEPRFRILGAALVQLAWEGGGVCLGAPVWGCCLIVGVAIGRWGQQSEVSAEVTGKWMGRFFCKWGAAAWSSLSRAQRVGPGCFFYELMEMEPKRTSLMEFCPSLCCLSLLQHALGVEYGLGVILATSTLKRMKLLWLQRKAWPAGYP